jgi:hypothetical protein
VVGFRGEDGVLHRGRPNFICRGRSILHRI